VTGTIREVYFFTHTHTDIGCTHPQQDVAEKQAANAALKARERHGG
jgi:hypothetical protein